MGAGHPQGARLALCVMVVVAVVEGVVVGAGTILVRHAWGRLYSNEEEVISYVAKMMPLLALSDFLDGFQCVLSGTKIKWISHSWFELAPHNSCFLINVRIRIVLDRPLQ